MRLGISIEEMAFRETEIFTRLHHAVTSCLDERQRNGQSTRLVAIHSFTPVYAGVARPWHAGVLVGAAETVAHQVLRRFRAHTQLNVALNEPYAIERESDCTVLLHGDDRNIDAVLLEIRMI
ncbi:putative N-formylglutamate amidohydrolase [Sphingomonas sp. UYAg733]